MPITRTLGQYFNTRVRGAIERRWHRREITIKTIAMTAFCMFLTAGPSYAQQTRSEVASAHYASTLLIPVAGDVNGAYGTHFQTDLSVTNHRDVAETVSVRFFGGDRFLYGDSTFETEVILPPRSSQTFRNVTGSLLQSPGQLGAIIIRSAGGELDATYRIWTTQPGTGGTLSQSSSALDMLELPPGNLKRVAIGVQQDSGFRTNVGVYCYVYSGCSFRVTASSSSGSVTTDVKVVGFALAQVPLPGANLGYMTVTIEPLDLRPEDQWAAYATTVDNVSGDSWLENAASE